MLRRNLVLIIKDISQNKLSFAINTIGLSFGMASATVLSIWVINDMKAEKNTVRHSILLLAFALIILIIASINYTNLSSARKLKRLKESGHIKVLKAVKRKLIIQYMMEAMLMSLLSLLTAICLVVIVLPEFNKIIPEDHALVLDSNILMFILGIALFSWLIAGIYPALFLYKFNLENIPKRNLLKFIIGLGTGSGTGLFQFFTSITLIIGLSTICYFSIRAGL